MKEKLLQEIKQAALELKKLSNTYKEMYVTAESLTAGFIGASIVEIPGSSLYFDRGFITYSNEAKMEVLGVKAETLRSFGAVSGPTVEQMVEGAINHASLATIGVAVSGIAGPDGGSAQKPVGTVWMGLKRKDSDVITNCYHFKGDREEVRLKTTLEAIKGLIALTKKEEPMFNDY